MITPDSNYRDLIRFELEKRSSVNSRYSLTAFAKDLGLAPSRLSEVLSGKQGLSREVAHRIASIVGLNSTETELFCDLVEAEHARSQEKRLLAKIRLQQLSATWDYSTFDEDIIKAISEIHHFSIIVALQSNICDDKPETIARKLGISETQAQSALVRLENLGVLARNAVGRLRPVKDFLSTTDNIPSEAIRNYQREILNHASIALEMQSVENRYITASIFSIRKSDLPRAKETLQRFQRKFMKDFGGGTNHNAVYCFSSQLFELTKDVQ